MSASHQSQINCIIFVLFFQLYHSALPLLSATTEMFHTSAFSRYNILKTSPQNNNNKNLNQKLNFYHQYACLAAILTRHIYYSLVSFSNACWRGNFKGNTADFCLKRIVQQWHFQSCLYLPLLSKVWSLKLVLLNKVVKGFTFYQCLIIDI